LLLKYCDQDPVSEMLQQFTNTRVATKQIKSGREQRQEQIEQLNQSREQQLAAQVRASLYVQ
jgi:hypothetical protein